MLDTDWAYLAGIIDADGSLGIYENGQGYYNFQIGICGDSLLMERLDITVPGGHINLANRTWHWNTNNLRIISQVLLSTLPYLTTKRLEAELMLECLGKEVPERESYSQLLKALKKLRHKACGGN